LLKCIDPMVDPITSLISFLLMIGIYNMFAHCAFAHFKIWFHRHFKITKFVSKVIPVIFAAAIGFLHNWTKAENNLLYD